jgi:acetyl-CoA acetyltransferase
MSILDTDAINPVRDRAAIVGVSHTGCVRRADTGLANLAVRACTGAVADAGLKLSDIDGVIALRGGASNPHDDPDTHYLIEALGLPGVRFWGVQLGGGAGPGLVAQAAMAVATGQCNYALAVRAMGAPATRVGYNYTARMLSHGVTAFTAPYGFNIFLQQFATWYRRYMHETGVRREQLGEFVVMSRQNALDNEKAVMRQPLTMDDYLAARWVCEPMSILDCDMPVDGAAAVVVTTPERARDLPRKPVYVSAATSGMGPRPDYVFWHDYTQMSSHWAAMDLWKKAGMGPSEMDFAMIYDGFAPFVFYWLEDLGFAKRSEVGEFVGSGALRRDGSLPANTHGGNLSEGRLHGMGHVVEAILQMRGDAGPRQLPKADRCVIGAGGTILAGALVLHS